MFLPTKTGCSENQKSLFCEKNHFLFSGQVQKMSLSHIAKNVPKTQFQPNLTFLYLTRKAKVIFFAKKSLFVYWPRRKNANFQQNWVFGPFLAIWLSDIFCIWSENKKWFFSQKNHFLFTEQPFLMAGKIGCIANPKLLWNILLLRPDVEDFKTWLFCISKGSPLML